MKYGLTGGKMSIETIRPEISGKLLTTSKPGEKPGKAGSPLARKIIGLSAWVGPWAGRVGPLRKALTDSWERKIRTGVEAAVRKGVHPPGVVRDRAEMGIAILRTIERGISEGRLGRAGIDRLLRILIGDSLVGRGIPGAKERFAARFGVRPPGFLLISPTKTCNLRCTGCYADSGATAEKLEWPIVQRLVREARELWGAVFVVISGGEPLAYRDEGKTVLDLAERNPVCFFMMYTNGTLIDDEVARRLGRIGNLTPAISVEGMGEATDKRRGKGVFARIIAAMERLRREKVLFGVSMTATRENAGHLLSDEVIDFYFNRQGALYGWLFHYMPIGRAFTLELLPTPEQRLGMWRRSWQLVYERHLLLADFWNSGTAALGCVSAGHEGGYLTVDWNGNVSPCVFIPYSPVNIHDVYSRGENLIDVWRKPFFARLRDWQGAYSNEKLYTKGSRHGNWMMPCPIRDHYDEFSGMLREFSPAPDDDNARAAMSDPAYRRGMIEYNRAVAALFDPIWKERYMEDIR
jgi:MoaA/NifB/PqqE/SkfB family radical SAM enzyme